MRSRAWALALALGLAALTVGLPIPGLRLLVVDQFAQQGIGSGAFAGLHVAGSLCGALLWGAILRRRSDVEMPLRLWVRLAFAASGLLLLGMGVAADFSTMLLLRFLDGVVHVAIVMLLMGAGALGDEQERARRMGWLGAVLVLGIGAGLGLGGNLAVNDPRMPFLLAAILAGIGVLITGAALPIRYRPGQPSSAMGPGAEPRLSRSVLVAMVLMLAERWTGGVLTVALPFGAEGKEARTVGMVLGLYMTAAVIVMPLTRRCFARFGAPASCSAASLALALSLALLTWPITMTMPWAILWALVAGSAAGALFMSGLLLVAARAEGKSRIRALGLVHAAGGLGHAIGAFGTGALVAPFADQPGLLVALWAGGPVLVAWLVLVAGMGKR